MELLVSFTLVIVLISALIKLITYHYNRLDLYRAGNKISGPTPVLPIIGNAHIFFGSTEKFMKRLMLLDNYKFSPIRFWLGPKLCIILFDPEQIKIVLRSQKTIEKDDLYKFFHPFLGTGLITAPENKWKVHRRLIMPTFNPKIIESFIDTMNKQSKILVKVLESEINGHEFSVFPYVSRCTLDIICETAMGVSSNVQTNRDSSYVKAIERLTVIFGLRMLKIWLHFDIIYKFTKLAREQNECIKYLHKHTNDIIEQKLKQQSEKINEKDDVALSGFKRKVFLDLLMELSKEGTKLTNEELREEVDTMVVAGNDTTATVNTFTIYMLANFPEVQNKCYEELVEIFGDKITEETEIEIEDLNRMEYLERVIKETMRLFPIAPLLNRKVNGDLDIGGGYTLPKGSTVIVAALKLHPSADFWEDPLSFNPDRFLPEEIAKRHPYTYIPFSGGFRNCIGLKYAMMSMKILLATLLRNYVLVKDKLANIEDIEVKAEIFIKTMTPITVKIKRRQHIST
ncbi:cytochrome P450 4C1-like [Cotesia glomerata]|uniref:cytochrome P450 4C1-like n=1 Tax=Cotesia glomerata TaxID=32391 RepID=UPI001D00E7A6|nr:cytochrome P450 4C1-like [Cotesia glomerata]